MWLTKHCFSLLLSFTVSVLFIIKTLVSYSPLTTERYSLGTPGAVVPADSPGWTQELEAPVAAVLGYCPRLQGLAPLLAPITGAELHRAVGRGPGVAALR